MKSFVKTVLAKCVCAVLISSLIVPPNLFAQAVQLPALGTLLHPTAEFHPINVKGLTVHPEDPFQFEFILDPGDVADANQQRLQDESLKMIKYFLTTLTVPDNEMWVNLSPVEKDRVIADGLGQTVMGKDLLALDYLLKQLTASLMNPETESGKKFWDKVYENVETQNFAFLQETIQSFNKVWIVPSKASIYQKGTTAIIVDNHLKVMLEEDYLASGKVISDKVVEKTQNNDASTLALYHSTTDIKSIIRAEIIPIIEKEVNEGETFANLRQIYNAMLLATWYKRHLKKSILAQVYIDQNKINGVESGDPQAINGIYDQYVASFKAGAANLIKEDYDPETQTTIARQYFTGGMEGYARVAVPSTDDVNLAQLVTLNDVVTKVSINPADSAMLEGSLKGGYRFDHDYGKQIEGSSIAFDGATTSGRIVFEIFNLGTETEVSLDIKGLKKMASADGFHIKDGKPSIQNNGDIVYTVSPSFYEHLQQSNIPLDFRIISSGTRIHVSFVKDDAYGNNDAMLFNPKSPYSGNPAHDRNWRYATGSDESKERHSILTMSSDKGSTKISYGQKNVDISGHHIKEIVDVKGEAKIFRVIVSPTLIKELKAKEIPLKIEDKAAGQTFEFIEDPNWPEVFVDKKDNGEAWVHLNRAERSNAFSQKMMDQLFDAIHAASADESVKKIVLIGEGSFFVGGADLKARQQLGNDKDAVRAAVDQINRVVNALANSPKTTVVVLNGPAYGGGVELALAADYRIMVDAENQKNHVALTETTLGIIPGAGGPIRLARLIGEKRAKKMILQAKVVFAKTAKAVGLVDEVVESMDAAQDFVVQNATHKKALPVFVENDGDRFVQLPYSFRIVNRDDGVAWVSVEEVGEGYSQEKKFVAALKALELDPTVKVIVFQGDQDGFNMITKARETIRTFAKPTVAVFEGDTFFPRVMKTVDVFDFIVGQTGQNYGNDKFEDLVENLTVDYVVKSGESPEDKIGMILKQLTGDEEGKKNGVPPYAYVAAKLAIVYGLKFSEAVGLAVIQNIFYDWCIPQKQRLEAIAKFLAKQPRTYSWEEEDLEALIELLNGTSVDFLYIQPLMDASQRLADLFARIRAEGVDLNKVIEILKKDNVSIVEMMRDSWQNHPNAGDLSVDQKWNIAQAFVQAGVRNVELTSYVHPSIAQMKNSDEVAQRLQSEGLGEGVNAMHLVMNQKGAERAFTANPHLQKIALNVAAADAYSLKNVKQTTDNYIEQTLVPTVDYIKTQNSDTELRAYISNVWGYRSGDDSEEVTVERVIEIIRKLQALGVTEIALSDTTGESTPQSIKDVLAQIIHLPEFAGITFVLHLHDRNGNGLLNALAGIEAGIRVFDTSAGNLGGTVSITDAPGNVPTEDFLFFMDQLGGRTGVDFNRYLEALRFLGMSLSDNFEGRQTMGLQNLKVFELEILRRQFRNELAVTTGKLREADQAMLRTTSDAQASFIQAIKSLLTLKQKWVWNRMDTVSRNRIGGSIAATIDQENQINSPIVQGVMKMLIQRLWPFGPRAVGAAFSKKPDTMSEVIMTTLIARGSQGIALIYDVWNALTAFPLWYAGTVQQKIKYLMPLLKGQVFFCFGLTEVRAAGSDAIRGIKSTAIRQTDGRYLMDFGKHYITVGEKAQYIIVFADVNPADVGAPEDKANRIGAFIVKIRDEKGNLLPGFEANHMEVMGHHGSGTLEIFSKEGTVYAEEILGDNWLTISEKRLDPKTAKTGANISMKTLEAGRISISSIALGSQLATIEELEKEYAERRDNMTRVQAEEWEDALREMRADFMAGWNLIRQVAAMKDKKKDYNLQAAALKMITTETAVRNTMRAMRLVGVDATLPGHPLERIFRDNKLLTIGEGTTQIMRNVIINELRRTFPDLKGFDAYVPEILQRVDIVYQGVKPSLKDLFEEYSDETDPVFKEIIQWQIIDLIAEGVLLKAGESHQDEDFMMYRAKVLKMPEQFKRDLQLLKSDRQPAETATEEIIAQSLADLMNPQALSFEKGSEEQVQEQILQMQSELNEFLNSSDVSTLDQAHDAFVASARIAAKKFMDMSEDYARGRTIQVVRKKLKPEDTEFSNVDVKAFEKVQVSHMLIERGRKLAASMSVDQPAEQLAATLMEIADIMVQVHGGYGYSTETAPSISYRKAAVFATMFLDRIREMKISLNNAMLTDIKVQEPKELVSDFVTYLMDKQPQWWTQEIKVLDDQRIGFSLKIPNRQAGANAINLKIGDRYHVFQMIESSNETVYTIFDEKGKYVAQGVYEGVLNKVVRALVNWAQDEGRKDKQAERNTKEGYIAELLQKTGLDNVMLDVDPVAYPKDAVLVGKVVALQGIGGVGGLLVAPLLNAGVKVIASDIDPAKVAQYQETFANFIQSGQLFVFVEDKIEGGYTSKIVNPLKYFSELREKMKIDSIDVFAPSAAGRVLNDQTIPELKEAGVKAVVGSANDVFADRGKHSQALHQSDILVVPDYIANFGGVFGVDAFLLNEPVTNSLVVATARRNVSGLLNDSKGQAPLVVADQKARAFFDALPRKTDKTEALALNGHRFEDGTVVRVYTSPEDLPVQVRDRWDDHYAVFELRNDKLGYVSYVSIHRLTKITGGQSDVLRGQFRATGGTRMRNYEAKGNKIKRWLSSVLEKHLGRLVGSRVFKLFDLLGIFSANMRALEDALELSKEMSFKTAGAGLPIGGSKCTINVTIDPRYNGPDQEKREKIITSYAQAIEYIGKQIGGGVLTGQDMNISVPDAKLMFVHAPTSIVPYVAGQFSIEPTPPTSVGVYNAIAATVQHLADNAALTPATPGGIDLNGSKTQIDLLGDDLGIEWKVDPAMLQRLRSVEFKGFNPVIIHIKPITATPLYSELTGQSAPKRADREGHAEMQLSYVRED